MRRRPLSNRLNAVVRHYAPDLARQAQALLAVLRASEAHQYAYEDTVEERVETAAQKQQDPRDGP